MSKELEEIYENCCHKRREHTDKCLALDEQEVALIHMCLKILGDEGGYNKDDYTTQGLFILLKTRNWDKDECKEDKVAEQPIKYKKFEYIPDYSVENVSELLVTYYAVMLLYVNQNCTLDYQNKLERNYFRVYAFFACICPKTFNVLIFNQIYLFMVKTQGCSLNVLKKYLIYSKELWMEYNELMNENKRDEVIGYLFKQFREIIAYDESALYANASKLYELLNEGFLAFDFMSGDTIPEARYGKIVNGIEYFERYLLLLSTELKKASVEEKEVYEYIESILENIKCLCIFFEQLIEDAGVYKNQITKEFTDTKDLLKKFVLYCDAENITLLEI